LLDVCNTAHTHYQLDRRQQSTVEVCFWVITVVSMRFPFSRLLHLPAKFIIIRPVIDFHRFDSSMAYKIEKRANSTPRHETSIDFSDRNYNVPLCGCSNYTDSIAVGDIIGVKLSANQKVRAKFSTTSRLLPGEKISMVSEQFGSFRPVEEHLFVVTKIHKPSKFEVAPYFLQGDKVIAKRIDERFCSEWDIPISEIEKYTLCEEMFVNRSLQQFAVPVEYDIFATYKMRKLFELLDSIDDSNRDTTTDKAIRKLFPLKRYTECVFELPKESEDLRHFHSNIARHEPLLQHYFGEECASILAGFGTYELVVAHMENLYQTALAMINSTTVKESVDHRLHIPSKLAVPTIHHTITSVKYNEIFRVYKPDPVYVLSKTKYVSNWGGVIVDNAIRNHFDAGNLVRVAFARNNPHAYQYEFSNVIYCRILQRLNETQHLACIENLYCSEYEDIVLVINSGAVSEVPFTFPGNENLEATGIDRNEGEGFGCTGAPAVVADKAEGEDGDGEHETYALNYDALIATVQSS